MINDANWTALIDKAIAEIEYPKLPTLYRPIEYTLQAGGKRLRPKLVVAACEAVGGNPEQAVNQAVGLELFHNFTLIHDDLMDKSSKRRGRPTVFHRWGDNQAVLSGDALMTMACQYMIKDCPAENLRSVLDMFNTTAKEIFEGQQYDMLYEKRTTIKAERYLQTITLKTAVMIGCACALGAIMGGAEQQVINALYNYGLNIGMAFQLRDDWLDVFGKPEELGKETGSDIINRKKTWLYITAMAERGEEFEKILNGQHSRYALVSRVQRLYEVLNLSNRCDKLIEDYRIKAMDALDSANLDEEYYRWFASLASLLSHRIK